MHLFRGPLPGAGDQARELALAHAMVRAAGAGDLTAALRVYRPSTPVMVFGRRETRSPGFGKAQDLAAEAGFEVAVRATGGRAVAYTGEAVVVDHVQREPQSGFAMEERFDRLGRLHRDVLVGLGVDARLGAVPGEYCPGAHSVNARGTAKLVGTAQRVVRDAWLFSVLVVVGDSDRVRSLLTGVYQALGQPFDGESVGAVSDEVPGLDTVRVEQAIVDAYAATYELTSAELDPALTELAGDLVGQHRAGG